mmetsp:Transcript_13463/g.18579  ORF Transcript_13463/g.18579 Transcript_13463/m.18579 type:complete len:310 (+) Transcript_13463:535-1464(+)
MNPCDAFQQMYIIEQVMICPTELLQDICRKAFAALKSDVNHNTAAYRIVLVSLQYRTQDVEIFIDRSHVSQLMLLFNKDCLEEIEMVSCILHLMYTWNVSIRSFIRLEIASILTAYKKNKHPGIYQLLELLKCIISGFLAPLKPQHSTLYTDVLLPLFCSPYVNDFFVPLSSCVYRMIEKEQSLLPLAVSFFMKCFPWPEQNHTLLYLSILSKLLPYLPRCEFDSLQVQFYWIFATCAKSECIETARLALSVFYHPFIQDLVKDNITIAFPMLYRPFQQNAVCHWNKDINQLSSNLTKMLLVYLKSTSN